MQLFGLGRGKTKAPEPVEVLLPDIIPTTSAALDWVEKSGVIFFLGGVVFLFVGVLCYDSFFQCDYVRFPDHDDWSTSAGYTLPQFLALVMGTYSLPLGLMSLLVYAVQSFKSTYWASFTTKFFVYLLLAAASLYGTFTSYLMSSEVIDCAIVCVGHDAEANVTNDAAVISTGLIYFLVTAALTVLFVSLAFLSLFAVFDARLHEGPERPQGKGSSSSSSSTISTVSTVSGSSSSAVKAGNKGETKPLLGKDADYKSLPSYAHKSAQARRSKARSLQTLLAMALTFGALYPLFFFACITLPTWWAYFSKHGIQSYEASRPSKEFGYYVEFNFGSDLALKLYPDILVYYGAIYVVSAVALLSHVYSPLQAKLASRPSVLLGLTVGEATLAGLLAALLGGQFAYWYLDHGWENEARSVRSKAELAARSVGQVANMVTGLLVLPVTRNSVWSAVFGVSWESMIVYHQVLGYLLLALVVLHALLWWVVYGQMGYFPHDVFAVPQKYHKDNFTVPLAVLSAVLMIVAMGVLSLPSVRRQHYDIFYWAHHFSLALFLVMLWHSTMSWYYITVGLTLWAADHAIRLYRSIGIAVKMEAVTVEGDGNVVHLVYTVALPGAPFMRSAYGPLPCQMGQFCFVNIPAVSQLAWHPFTISSAPEDSATHHHIKSQGADQWTERLLLVVRAMQMTQGRKGPRSKPLTINIDGPYGFPLDIARFRSVLLVAGGIGITPLHATYKHLYLASQGSDRWSLAHIKSVKLIWVVSNYLDATPFDETLHSMQTDGGSSKGGVGPTFSYSLYVTNSREAGGLDGIEAGTATAASKRDKKSPPPKASKRDAKDKKAASSAAEKLQRAGRPDLQTEILSLSPWSYEAAVFVCGPAGLVAACDGLCRKAKVHFKSEAFEL